MNDDDNIFKRNPPDIILDMSTFGTSRPGAGIVGIPDHDSLIGPGTEPEYPAGLAANRLSHPAKALCPKNRVLKHCTDGICRPRRRCRS